MNLIVHTVYCYVILSIKLCSTDTFKMNVCLLYSSIVVFKHSNANCIIFKWSIYITTLQYEYIEMKMRCYLWTGYCPSTTANAATSALWAVWLVVVFRPTTAVRSHTDVL